MIGHVRIYSVIHQYRKTIKTRSLDKACKKKIFKSISKKITTNNFEMLLN